MFTNKKDIFLVITLIVLCTLIKCKLDADKDVSTKQETSLTSSSKIKPEAKLESVITQKDSQSKEDKSQNLDSKKTDDSFKKEKKSTVSEPAPKKVTTPVVKKKKKKKPVKKVAKARAKIEFEEMLWDFGEITEGDIIKKKFKFTNTGNAPLQIIGADASCGCARPIVPFLDIAPGESNEIGVTYNSVNKDGDQKPEIIIESNTYPKHNVLKLRGTVKAKPKEKEKEKINADSLKVKQDTTEKN